MIQTNLSRLILRLAALFNFGAATLALSPQLAALAGLPPLGPWVYRWLLAMLIALFGALYFWLGQQARPPQPILFLAGVGKTLAFLAIAGGWWLGEVAPHGVALGAGDLTFAVIFFSWAARP